MAGSHFAIELLDSLHNQYRDEPLGRFAMALKIDGQQDQATLNEIIDRVGKSHLDLKEAAGWFAEKVSQLKLRRDDSGGGIGTFEALETLMLGIRGKFALWQGDKNKCVGGIGVHVLDESRRGISQGIW